MARRMWWALGAIGVGLGLVVGLSRIAGRRTSLQGAVVLITGGSRGLGLALARELASRGATVAICGRDDETLRRAREDLQRRGATVLAIQADITDPEDVRSVVRRVRTVLGPIDVLVNNAGRMEVGPLDSMTEADHRGDLELHFWAPLRLVEAVLPEMKARGHGHIVNISSIGGRIAVPHMLPYSASKHALTGLSRGLRAELARFGITVITVTPGLVNTGSPPNAAFKGHHELEYAWFSLADRVPGLSVSARYAARRIRKGIERGRTELVIGAPARLALWAHDLAPRATYRVLAGLERLMPAPNGDVRSHAGWESRSRLSARAPFSRRQRRAVRELNQEAST